MSEKHKVSFLGLGVMGGAIARHIGHAGHDLTMPMHFLCRRYNQRTDEYGGSLENRARLFRELIEDTREAVGDTCAVAVRFAVDQLPGQISIGGTDITVIVVAHDLNYQSLAGIPHMTGDVDGPPQIPGNAIADDAGGISAALGMGILSRVLPRPEKSVEKSVEKSDPDGKANN